VLGAWVHGAPQRSRTAQALLVACSPGTCWITSEASIASWSREPARRASAN
jgi:hypothetical protein